MAALGTGGGCRLAASGIGGGCFPACTGTGGGVRLVGTLRIGAGAGCDISFAATSAGASGTADACFSYADLNETCFLGSYCSVTCCDG